MFRSVNQRENPRARHFLISGSHSTGRAHVQWNLCFPPDATVRELLSETRRCGIWRWLVGIYGIANWGGNSFRPVQGDYTGCQAAAGHGPDAFYISQQQKSQLGQAHRTCQVGSDAHDRDESLRVVAGKRNDDDEMEGKQKKNRNKNKQNRKHFSSRKSRRLFEQLDTFYPSNVARLLEKRIKNELPVFESSESICRFIVIVIITIEYRRKTI